MLKLSIVTVVRNAEKTVLQTLQSVASQDYPLKEHWVLDGLSTDGTTQIIEEFAKTHPHVKWQSQADKGMYHALNAGIALATGEVVGLLHSDDFYAHDQVLSAVAKGFEDPKRDALYSDLVYVDPESTQKIVRYWRAKPFEYGDFAKGIHPPHPSLFLRKSVYESCGAFDARMPIGNDVEFMMRVFEKHHIRSHYEPKVWVMMRMGGISNRSFSNVIKQNKVIGQAFKQNDIPFSWLKFCFYKIINRALQFLTKPKELPYGS